RRSGVRGTPAKVNANAGLAASDKVNSASVSDGSHESVYLGPFCVPTPLRKKQMTFAHICLFLGVLFAFATLILKVVEVARSK
ncbi:hypothetical protein, partial [Sphingomonas sp. DC1100-1]|uniref:hypothetical protein n=1 Tax=unclassified Sphingomonas TaxID=196159 RepID=UPI003CF9AE02